MKKVVYILLITLIFTFGFAYRAWFLQSRSGDFQVIKQWGSKGSEPGQFDEPMGIAIDIQDMIYVADARNARIQKFDSEGNYKLQWGSTGSEAGQFEKPIGIAISLNQHIYVSDFDLDRIQVFDENGKYLFQWGSPGSEVGQFNAPAGIGIGPDGSVYVADFYNHRVQIFTSGGKYIGSLGSSGRFWSGALHYPTDVHVDNEGNIFVADAYNYRIQKFLPDKRFSHKWGGPFGWGIHGKWHGWFNVPSGVSTDKAGNIFIADSGNHRIVVLSQQGKALQSLSLPTDSIMYSPTRIAADSKGYIYAVDTASSKILKLQYLKNK